MAEREGEWYWCLHHARVETFAECPADRRLGPYASAEDARRWHERVEARNDAWDDEDERWERPERR